MLWVLRRFPELLCKRGVSRHSVPLANGWARCAQQQCCPSQHHQAFQWVIKNARTTRKAAPGERGQFWRRWTHRGPGSGNRSRAALPAEQDTTGTSNKPEGTRRPFWFPAHAINSEIRKQFCVVFRTAGFLQTDQKRKISNIKCYLLSRLGSFTAKLPAIQFNACKRAINHKTTCFCVC